MSSGYGSPQCKLHEHTWTHINCTVGWISLAWRSPWISTTGTCKSACSMSGKTDHVGVTSYGETWPRSSPSSTRASETNTCLARNRTQASAVGGEHFSKDLYEQLINGNIFVTAHGRPKNKTDSALHNMNWYRREKDDYKLNRIRKKQKICRGNAVWLRNIV